VAAVVVVLSAAMRAHPVHAATAAARESSGSWQETALDLGRAWQLTQGAHATVAIVDTGVAADHPALRGRVLPGVDLVHGDAQAGDDNGHGTALAGVVAGVCPACRILPVKVLGADRTGSWTTIAAGIRWAADHGADVINLSFGAPRAIDDLGSAVAYALSKNAIVVAAAGNDGLDENFYPARYPGVVSVAAVDENDLRYTWSNFGGWVTVAAPGCATAASPGGGYVSNFCGTSTAAPFVAGLAGLARSYQAGVTPAAFDTALIGSTTPVPQAGITGSGVPDANRLLLSLGAPSGPPTALALPQVVGVPKVGRLLGVRVGWKDAVSSAVVWQRSRAGSAWEQVGAGSAFRPRPRDAGYALRVVVTATNPRGSTTSSSAPTRAVARTKPASR
jgi:subtilisin family serine protease